MLLVEIEEYLACLALTMPALFSITQCHVEAFGGVISPSHKRDGIRVDVS